MTALPHTKQRRASLFALAVVAAIRVAAGAGPRPKKGARGWSR